MQKELKNLKSGEVFIFNGLRAMKVNRSAVREFYKDQEPFVYLDSPGKGLIHWGPGDTRVELIENLF